jgi:hypothetical protein
VNALSLQAEPSIAAAIVTQRQKVDDINPGGYMNRDQWRQKCHQHAENSDESLPAQPVSGNLQDGKRAGGGIAIGIHGRQPSHFELTCCEWAAIIQGNPDEGN